MRPMALPFALAALLLATPIWADPAQDETSPAASPAGADETSKEEAGDKDAADKDRAKREGRVFRDRVVVTASRAEEISAATPAPITVIDRAQIEEQQPEKLADLFKEIPGVEVFGEGPFRGLPVIRGFSSNRVLILVDGQRLNNSRESTSFAGIQPGLVNIAQVERIEVLRGPASVQYGSDAIGGVVNIITRQPELGAQEFTLSGDVAYEYGTASESHQPRAFVAGAGKGYAFEIGASYQEAGDYSAASGAAESSRFAEYVSSDDVVYNSGMQQTSVDGSFRFQTGERGVFRIGLEAVRTDDVGFPGFDPSSGIDISFPRFDRDKLRLGWSSGPLWGLEDVSLHAYYQQVVKESVRNFDFGPFFFSNNFTRSDIDTVGFNAQSTAELAAQRLIFGVDFYRDKLHDDTLAETIFGTSTEVAVPDSRQTGLGLYVQDRIRVGDRLSVYAGLRGDRFDFKSEDDPDYAGEPFDVTDSALSGNLGLTYAVTDHVNLTALVARGFRSPNLQERSYFGIVTTGDTLIIQNPDLKSENSLNYEVGFKARYDRYFGGLSMFYNDVTDFISYEFLGTDPDSGLELARFANIDKAKVWGVEFDLETILGRRWSAFTNASYTRGSNDRSGEPLPFIPPLKAAFGVRFQERAWWAEAALRVVTKQDRVPEGETSSAGFTVYDLSGGFDLSGRLGIVAALRNLTDKLYAEPFNNRPEPGRNLRVSLRYGF